MTQEELSRVVRELLHGQLFGILATQGNEGPHTNIVSFITADNLQTLVFATPRESRKYANIVNNREVTFFTDNRSNRKEDFEQVCGVEALGKAVELEQDSRYPYQGLFVAKYPELEDFVSSAALVRIQVRRYDVVHRFQNVLILDVGNKSGGG